MLRPVLTASLATAALFLLLSATRGSDALQESENVSLASMNHWIMTSKGVDPVREPENNRETVEYMREHRPDLRYSIYKDFAAEETSDVHCFFEAINSTAQVAASSTPTGTEEERLFSEQNELYETKNDIYMRLISADPEREAKALDSGGLVIWTFDTHFARRHEAHACVRALTERINEANVGYFARSYSEWFPTSGRVHLYFYGSGIAAWERFEAWMDADEKCRDILAGAADAFIEESFKDRWLRKTAY